MDFERFLFRPTPLGKLNFQVWRPIISTNADSFLLKRGWLNQQHQKSWTPKVTPPKTMDTRNDSLEKVSPALNMATFGT